LTCANPGASDPYGAEVTAACQDGAVIVVAPTPVITVTPTP
jgi:hypothetical protein